MTNPKRTPNQCIIFGQFGVLIYKDSNLLPKFFVLVTYKDAIFILCLK